MEPSKMEGMALKDRIIILSLFVGFFGLYVATSAPAVTAGDSGEFMTSVITLSLAHAPSYPLFTLITRPLVQLFHYGSLPLRVNYSSAFYSALALLVLYAILRRLG